MVAVKRKAGASVGTVKSDAKKPRATSHAAVQGSAAPEQQQAADDDSEDDLDMSSSESDESESAEEDEVMEEGAAQESSAREPSNGSTAKESHAKQKQELLARKAAKPHADIISRAKGLWSQLNRKKVPKQEREKVIKQLFDVIQGNVVEIIFKHDANRVIQAAFKYGSTEQRLIILGELKGRIVDLSKSTYSKFLVVKMLLYGNAEVREKILAEIHGNVRKLIKHKEAAYVVEDAFRDYATPAQQEMLLSELYGAEFSVFATANQKPLAEILAASPEKRDLIMRNLWESISGSIKKGSIGFTFLHRALLVYLQNCSATERVEAIETVRELLPEFVHTLDGADAAGLVIAHATAKDRKLIMKALKPHIASAMRDEFGWLAVVALYMSVDDTVLLNKAMSPEIKAKLLTLLEDRHARKVFLYILGGCQARHYNAKEMAYFATIQKEKATTSKKEDSVRRQEVAESVSPMLVEALAANIEDMLADPAAAPLILEIMLHATEVPEAPTDKLLAILKQAPQRPDLIKEHTPRMLKALVQGGFWNPQTKSVEATQVQPTDAFAKRFAPLVAQEAAFWASGDASFAVVALLETLGESTELASLSRALKDQQSEIQAAADAGNKGSRIILTKLK
ncbi:armadillo-type protein [Protomyces lactucae-debilis]|uniref:Armadillo-type protein n=1 Tax=Protomyces lactucae-debilis TaxID=2754530 RepID=A0A1Y2F4B9_PROLT|nr:armadillo-type protein [Protomyces lactucae-debilis]ORY78166.1 armadillo-type protein [Protomyces lactucae-debilis]